MGPVGDAEFVTNYETYMRYDGRSKAKTVQQLIDKSKDLADTNTPVNPARIKITPEFLRTFGFRP